MERVWPRETMAATFTRKYLYGGLQERFNTDNSYAIGFTVLTASIHNNDTELANNLLELGKIASPLSSHVSNI